MRLLFWTLAMCSLCVTNTVSAQSDGTAVLAPIISPGPEEATPPVASDLESPTANPYAGDLFTRHYLSGD